MKAWNLPYFDVEESDVISNEIISHENIIKQFNSDDFASKNQQLPKIDVITQEFAPITSNLNLKQNVQQATLDANNLFEQGFNAGYAKAKQELEATFKSKQQECEQKNQQNFAQKYAEQQTKVKQQLELLANLTNQIEQSYRSQIPAIEQAILKIIHKIAYAVIGWDLPQTQDLKHSVIKQALSLIAPNMHQIKITANSKDCAYINEICAKLAIKPIIIIDDNLLLGGCIISSEFGTIDASIEQRLKQVLAHLQ